MHGEGARGMPEPTRRDGALLGRLACRKNRGRVHDPYMIRTVCSPRLTSNLGVRGFRVKLTNRRSPSGTGCPAVVAQVQQDKDISMLWRASDLHGFDIKATDGAIGSVDDFLFSDDDWIVRWAVIDTGNWLPSRQILLPPNRLTSAAKAMPSPWVSAALNRRALRSSFSNRVFGFAVANGSVLSIKMDPSQQVNAGYYRQKRGAFGARPQL